MHFGLKNYSSNPTNLPYNFVDNYNFKKKVQHNIVQTVTDTKDIQNIYIKKQQQRKSV